MSALQVTWRLGPPSRGGARLQQDQLPDWIGRPVLRSAFASLASSLWSLVRGVARGYFRAGLAGQFEVEPPVVGVSVHRHPSDHLLGSRFGARREGPFHREPIVSQESVFKKSQLVGSEVPGPTGLAQPPVTARPPLELGRLGQPKSRLGDEDSRETDLPRSNGACHATLHT